MQLVTEIHRFPFPLSTILVLVCGIHCGKILHGVIKGRRFLSIRFIVQVFTSNPQKDEDDDDDDGRCTMFLYCMEFICFATKVN